MAAASAVLSFHRGNKVEPNLGPDMEAISSVIKTNKEESVNLLRKLVRNRVMLKNRLHRFKLAERLIFEHDMLFGTIRLMVQILFFALFMATLIYSRSEQTYRGIFQDLHSSFSFPSLEKISSLDQFVSEGMPTVAQNSKKYFLLSSKYFDSKAEGSLQLLGPMTTFAEAKLGPQVTLKRTEFSFVTWVHLFPQFLEGYLLRKRPVQAGDGEELSCWGWFLHRKYGPQLIYGAHDFSENDSPFNSGNQRQFHVGLSSTNSTKELNVSTHIMLTMIVTETNVTFFANMENLGTVDLPRHRLTDCYNNNEGILLGSTSLQLGLTRFYPFQLDSTKIEDLLKGGSLLSDLASGSEPMFLEESEVATVGRGLRSTMASIDSSVSDTDTNSEAVAILKRTEELEATAAVNPAFQSANGPIGSTTVNSTLLTDAATNRQFTQLIKGPWMLSETFGTTDHRDLRGIPSFEGTGATFTFWYRHFACPKQTCGVYLLSVIDDNHPSPCWSLWMERNAIWYDNPLGNPPFQYPHDFVPDQFELFGDLLWRHIAMVFDETTNNVRYYMDGELAWEGPWGSAVTGADCHGPNKRMAIGRIEPGYNYGAPVEMYDFRMYVHRTSSPLSTAEILAISELPTPGIDASKICLPITSHLMEESSWTDKYGHGCDWYSFQRATHPEICAYPPAAQHCPLACGSRQECFRRVSDPPTYFTWDRIKKIESRSSDGTICLGNHLELGTVRQRCEEWVSNGGGSDTDEILAWADSMGFLPTSTGRKGKRLNLTDCDQLVEAVDSQCDLNTEQIRQFTEDVVSNGGDFTMSFWMRPVGDVSLHESLQRFFPHISFYSSLSPPKHNVLLGLWENPNGEFRILSSCGTAARDLFENVEVNSASNDEWTFFSISRKNTSSVIDPSWTTTATNLGKNKEISTIEHCLYDSTEMFNAVEINYPSLVSPIMMIPEALPFARVQQIYLRSVGLMKIRNGPLLAAQDMDSDSKITIVKQDFAQRSVVLAPPLVFQKRRQPTSECGVEFSSTFIKQQHTLVQEKCLAPFHCSDNVVSTPEATIACPGDAVEGEAYFGLQPIVFRKGTGYTDFLYSITDNPFLLRDGAVVPTGSFLDSATESAELVLVFYTPSAGVTTVMTVRANFGGSASAAVKVKVRHFEILRESHVGIYLILQVLNLVFVLAMSVDIIQYVWGLWVNYEEGDVSLSMVCKIIVDATVVPMVIAFSSWNIPTRLTSDEETEDILGKISQLRWDSTEITFAQKTEQYFTEVKRLLDITDDEDKFYLFCSAILFTNLLRLILATAVHPRLALLTSTIFKAADDLWHAAIILLLLMLSFAGIATWQFGDEWHQFRTFGATLKTQFEMMFGEFPENWADDPNMSAYTMFYFVVVFLLVQNFLLAIIVQALMDVRQDNIDLETECEFFTDMWLAIGVHWKAFRRGWPSQFKLGRTMMKWQCKKSVGFKELKALKIFSSDEKIGEFLDYYLQFPFLEPDAVGEYPTTSQEGGEVVDALERRLANLVGYKVQTLRELAEENIRIAEERRSLKQQKYSNALAKVVVVGAPASSSGQTLCSVENSKNGEKETRLDSALTSTNEAKDEANSADTAIDEFNSADEVLTWLESSKVGAPPSNQSSN